MGLGVAARRFDGDARAMGAGSQVGGTLLAAAHGP